jgi:aspartate/methionine/tyrosine aminotransferase
MVGEYRARREIFVAGLNGVPGFRCVSPEGAFYAWVNVAGTGLRAEEVARLLLEEGGVAAIAGGAFGAGGREYLRFSLVSAPEQLREALRRIAKVAGAWAK